MAAARLPEPARQDKSSTVVFPLENKRFVMESMDFEIVDDDGDNVTLAPLRVTVLHSDFTVNLQDRLEAIARDLQQEAEIRRDNPELADAIRAHATLLEAAKNTSRLREAADTVIELQTEVYGLTNAGSIATLTEYEKQPPADIEELISGKEGKLLARIHYYKERDRGFAQRARNFYRSKHEGNLTCEVCNLRATTFYGVNGEACIEIHHKTPISQLQPDSVTVVDDVAVLCASCHRMVHSENPCLDLDALRQIVTMQKAS